MFPEILRLLQDCVRGRRYVVTLHAEEEIDDDDLSIFDVERAILTGSIIERQKDRETEEWKYVIHGQTLENDPVTVVTKVGRSGKAVVITVFREE